MSAIWFMLFVYSAMLLGVLVGVWCDAIRY
jgi:hypothetical protein